MQNPIRLLFSLFRRDGRPAYVKSCEPLDHPSLISVCRRVIDDLPLPAYAIRPDGSVEIRCQANAWPMERSGSPVAAVRGAALEGTDEELF
jgi:hypothetical protein